MSTKESIERWEKIKDYTRYQVSTHGHIKGVKGKLLNPVLHNQYYSVGLKSDKDIVKIFRVHRIVALHFVKNDDDTLNNIVDHIDNNKLNNHFTNLRWVTNKENSSNYHKHYRTKFGEPILQYDLNGNFIKEWTNAKEVENICGYKYISDSLSGRYKSSYGFVWKYKTSPKIIIIKDDEKFKNVGTFDENNFSNYNVSNYGTIYSMLTKKYLYATPIIGQYISVGLICTKTKKTYDITIHRLVAYKFVNGRSSDKKWVNHLDENKHNNHYLNLKWVTPKENSTHSLGKQVKQIDSKTGKVIHIYNSVADANIAMNISSCCIYNCCYGRQKYVCGYIWQFVNNFENKKIALDNNEHFKNIGIYKKYDFSRYKISNYGKIYSIDDDIYIMPSKSNYYTVNLFCKNDTMPNKISHQIYIHRLVAQLFVNCKTKNKNKQYVKHIDNNVTNNYYLNLEWTNIREHYLNKGRKVNQIDIKTGKILNIYNSASIARKAISIDSSIDIIKCCDHLCDESHGFKWEWTH